VLDVLLRLEDDFRGGRHNSDDQQQKKKHNI
jgi:hypothetical protein